ncbi:VNG_1110C family protein [Halegenticoccus soli]|uniref:VNG_1110C family protein n=1 Tax=Halegenticoccus soli TaxID=1985678 RepID=UPI000C6E90B8|nr:hypothetical protein [Halegenticoccus soli]
MPDAGWFRDSTQIVLPKDAVAEYRDELCEAFMITLVDENDTVRLIGSPVVITDVREWLEDRGISVT